jgi:hypothetical protein
MALEALLPGLVLVTATEVVARHLVVVIQLPEAVVVKPMLMEAQAV